MNQNKLSKKLTKLNERACWLDGMECPYGKPEGQFLLRPTAFCRMPENGGRGRGCLKIFDHEEELLELSRIHVEVIRESMINPNDLESILTEKSVKLFEMIRGVSENYTGTERKILELAGEILYESDGNGKNPEVIRSSELDPLL